MNIYLNIILTISLFLASCLSNFDIIDKGISLINNPTKAIVNSILSQMTLEEKIGQMFMVDANSIDDRRNLTVLTENSKDLLAKYKLGGVIFFKNNIVSITQTQKLISDLQDNSKIPLFISVDEEGGKISRIASNLNMHATVLPNSNIIGTTKKPKNAYLIGQILGKEISSLDFNMNFAPVADINTNPNNPVIGVRSYGNDEKLVAEMVYNCILGMQDQNVSSVIKHFPGHGDTATDTHKGTVIVKHDIERLRNIEFIPFKKGIQAGVDGIMIAHIKVPNVTNEEIEASLSKEVVTNILRNELGYKGLIITDALNMGAIANVYGTKKACVKAVLAGVDILLMPIPFEEGYNEVLKSVKSGIITEEKINESVIRILETKIKRKLFKKTQKNPEKELGSQQNMEILKSILE